MNIGCCSLVRRQRFLCRVPTWNPTSRHIVPQLESLKYERFSRCTFDLLQVFVNTFWIPKDLNHSESGIGYELGGKKTVKGTKRRPLWKFDVFQIWLEIKNWILHSYWQMNKLYCQCLLFNLIESCPLLFLTISNPSSPYKPITNQIRIIVT